ncbi:exopolysaccharide biosynthesis polyprenyl glycosylphosphotransferase [Haloferax sp. Atlit-6N]|uniref:sugar transferase n=1 Tax=Haloferax sp. Atlit-6N TaxID=2077205 RepID=UPI000E22508E|nr:sugar transferase [Haloferax sp. Atlit-6N]REA02037.1 exopolysaccharide biosynthesis polyprenyl glycosylphosphotransferase [Haloferax sp. Atlit-6N]
MNRGFWYRVESSLGVALVTAFTVTLVNGPLFQQLFSLVPVLNRLVTPLPGVPEGAVMVLTAVVVVTGAFIPLYKPRPRRIIDVVALVHKRVFVAVLALATIGYFDYTYRLPRLTLIAITPVLLTVLPVWFVWIRQRPLEESQRAIIVSDNHKEVRRTLSDIELPVLGYLCPTTSLPNRPEFSAEGATAIADGGMTLDGVERLGGLSRIEDILVEYNVDTVILAFEHSDRAEFFGILDACYEHGVDAKVHRDHADQVLTGEEEVGTIVDVTVEPWDVQDYMLKRAFDVIFAAVGLFVLTPIIVLIAAAIKLDDGGAVLYKQARTAVFGETFDVYKFRSMVPEGESAEPVDDDQNDRITSVGRVLRRTHLDEIPQLWSILVGDMSVVGPRAVWTEEEPLLAAETQSWRQRWFVKPGLTGLAQVNDVKSTDPEQKLRYDLQYVKEQSFSLDVMLVTRQIWKVLEDVVMMVRGTND